MHDKSVINNISSSAILLQAENIYLESIDHARQSCNTIDVFNHVRYPLIRISIEKYHIRNNISSLSYGILPDAGIYETTMTQIDSLKKYYLEQLDIILENQQCKIGIFKSKSVIPITFIDEKLLNNFHEQSQKKLLPNLLDISYNEYNLSMFHGYRIDHSIKRLEHYTKSQINEFQEYIIFVNYQMYINAFKEIFGANNYTQSQSADAQMFAIHSSKYNISIINIGVGPSNAKNITDHVSVLRSKLWIMLGHCAGLSSFQKIGDYILAQGYIRQDGLMDTLLPQCIPLPIIKPIEDAIYNSCGETIHSGTIISTADRNWEMKIEEMTHIIRQSNAIALDMESGTIASNAFLNKIPYSTFLCISDLPMHGILKLPEMAKEFYRTKIYEHSNIIFNALLKIQQLSLHEQLKYIRHDACPPWR